VTNPSIQPLPFRVLIDEAMKEWRRHFKTIYPSVALPLAIVVGPLTVGYTERLGKLMGTSAAPSFGEFVSLFGSFGIWLAAVTVVNLVATSALQAATLDAVAGREVSMTRSWLFALRPRVLGTVLLNGILVLMSLLFCFIPAIYVGPLLSLTMPVMRIEGTFGLAALKRSAALARYNRRLGFTENPLVKILALFLVVGLLSYAINMVIQLPIAVVQQIVIMRDVVEGQTPDPQALMSKMVWFQAPAAVLGSLTNTTIQLYMGCALGLLFLDIRRRREGTDLEEALDAMGAPALAEAEPA